MRLSLTSWLRFQSQVESFVPVADPLPAPTSIKWGSGCPLILAKDLSLTGSSVSEVTAGFDRFVEAINGNGFWTPDTVRDTADLEARIAQCGNLTTAQTIEVSIKASADLQLGVDESYRLEVTGTSITIGAPTQWGAIHGLKTLEQLLVRSPVSGDLLIESTVAIDDRPLYPHRGLSLDTSRNFYPIPSLKRQIDSLASAKMNVFHWHLSDTQSFPIELKTVPEITLHGPFSPDLAYSQDEVRDLVEYARVRGVRVVPELDIPGHSSAGWAQADPRAVICRDISYFDNPIGLVGPQLDLTYEGTYDLIDRVYTELSSLFPDALFHVGFDELWPKCTNLSPHIQEWLEARNFSYPDLGQYYVDKTVPIFSKIPGRRLVMWEDALLGSSIHAHNLPQSVILQTWEGGMGSVRELISRGHSVVISNSDFLYLDCGAGSPMAGDRRYLTQEDPDPQGKEASFNYRGDGGSWCAPYKTWQRIYLLDFHHTLSTRERSKVLGSEVALWSEQTDDAEVDSRVWPRSASLGELLWSGNRDEFGEYRASEFYSRILLFRERLVSKGVRAAAIGTRDCVSNPSKCDLRLLGKNRRKLPGERP